MGWRGPLLASPWVVRAAGLEQNRRAIESALLIIIITFVFIVITRGQMEQN